MNQHQPSTSARPPSGLRRITRPMLDTLETADTFSGLTGLSHWQVLAAFKAAAPILGLPIRVIAVIDWLFKFTQPIDWRPGSRPIVWPSAAEQQEALGLSAAQVKYLNRKIGELGLVVMRDSPNGRRFGVRTQGKTGPIILAYGFDLSPLGARLAEFQDLAAEGKAHKGRMKALRRRARIARNSLSQILETATTENAVGFDAIAWQRRAASLADRLEDITNEDALVLAVGRLESTSVEARETLKLCFSSQSATTAPVEADPKGPENKPPITTTNESLNPSDTVTAAETSSIRAEKGTHQQEAEHELQPAWAGKQHRRIKRLDAPSSSRQSGSAFRITPQELTRLAPRLLSYVRRPSATWADIVEAADWLRGDLGISRSLWGEACLVLGRNQAAVAVAIVSAKPEGYLRSEPGAYFFGMLQRAKSSELNLAKTIWGMRAARKEQVLAFHD